jgi:hypothetical protein
MEVQLSDNIRNAQVLAKNHEVALVFPRSAPKPLLKLALEPFGHVIGPEPQQRCAPQGSP